MPIIDDKVLQYLNDMSPIKDEFLKELQNEGIKTEVPIIQEPSLKLIEIFLNLMKPKVMIEVGTAIAYSTIWLAKAFPDMTIHTIERKEIMIGRAKDNIAKANLTDRIILHEGEALDILPLLPKADIIFIDAAKGKYQDFFELAYPLLKVGGIFLFDNILFRGYIADESIYTKRPMLRKIRRFNDNIAANEKLKTSFVPIGDGLAISYKLEE